MREHEALPKVLVISHNVFSGSGNMGKTLESLLKVLPPENLAQLYFHAERPTRQCCLRYFRITDTDILRSVLHRRAFFREYTAEEIAPETAAVRIDRGLTAKVYQFCRRRTPLIYCLRNALWRLGKWKSQRLDAWIREFSPDLIFFAAGDYAFAYRIVDALSQTYALPVVTWCCDDFYIHRASDSLLGRSNHSTLMRWAYRVMEHTRCLVTISDKMARDYAALFGVPTHVLRISASSNEHSIPWEQRHGIVYLGNLGRNRATALVELGRALSARGERIEVYSAERREKTLRLLTEENGITFHGSVSPAQARIILGEARYVLHVEAFDRRSRRRTVYSLSTKIGEYLSSGACILAYGPDELSSMTYLRENSAAIILRSAAEIEDALATDCSAVIANAQQLARRCHSGQDNNEKMRSILHSAWKSR